jgi:hypothetical protein
VINSSEIGSALSLRVERAERITSNTEMSVTAVFLSLPPNVQARRRTPSQMAGGLAGTQPGPTARTFAGRA